MDKYEAYPEVIVMMSTYNGAKYIQQQIESILAQEKVCVDLYIRDDSSNDETVDVVEQYGVIKQCHLIKGKNIGAAASFIELLFTVPQSEYYAFCDQDDVWDKDKLSTAINKIEKCSGPALYHGLAGRVDENLNPLQNAPYNPKQTFGASLLTSATGCTMVFNNALMSILRKYRPSFVSMHDAWVYRVAYAFNSTVIYDSNSHMKYRQHGNNVSGGNLTSIQRFMRQLTKNKGMRYKTAEELYRGYYKYISNDNKKILHDFVNYRNSVASKTRVLISDKYDTSSIKTTLQYKLLFLFNMI